MREHRRLLVRVAALCCLPAASWAQGATVTGTVRGRQEQPIEGAIVALRELNIATTTNAAGVYHLSVPAPQAQGQVTLRATFLGYKPSTQTITLAPGTQRHDVTLEQSAVALEGVVVTALGVERQERSLAYAVQKVGGEQIAQSPVPNVVDALAGKTAGVNIVSSGGRAGAGSRIVLRGESSFQGNSQPLFVVDGVPISNDVDATPSGFNLDRGNATNRAIDIDPNSIEEVSVLKGAAASALYGSRAANGAIIITTKRGTGRPVLTVSSRLTSETAILGGLQDEYLQGNAGFFSNGLPLSRGGYVQPGYPGTDPQQNLSWGPHKRDVDPAVLQALGVGSIPTYDPRKEFFRTGRMLENAANLSGAISTGTYFLGLTHTNQGGITPGTEFARTNVTANLNTTLGSRINSATNLMLTQDGSQWLEDGYYGPTRVLSTTPISFDAERPIFEDGTPRMLSASQPGAWWYPDNAVTKSDVTRFIGGQMLSLNLMPKLSLANRIGFDTYTDQRINYNNEQPWSTALGNPSGNMWDQKVVRSNINNDLTLNLNETSLGRDLTLSGLVGHNVTMMDYRYGTLSGAEINVPGLYNIENFNRTTAENFRSRQRLLGLYGEATVGYRNYLYLRLTGRNDWSSTLPKGANSFFYPSASLGFVFTDAFGWSNRWLEYGKLRVSRASAGNSAPPYRLTTTYDQVLYTDFATSSISFGAPFNGVNAYRPGDAFGNPTLKPEITTETEAGLDMRLLGGRASTEFTWYDRVSRDQIFEVPASFATGYGSILRNAGELRNRGVELSVAATPVDARGFRWDVQANYSRNRSSVISLAPGVSSIALAGYSWPQVRIMAEEGYGVLWGFGYQRNERGQVLVGDNGMPLVDPNLKVIGNIQPDWLGNFRSTFAFRGVSLSALVDTRQGGDVLNFDMYYTVPNGMAEVTERRNDQYVWPGVNATTGQPNTVPVTRDQAYWTQWARSVQENLVEDGSYVRLRELTLSYAVPSALLRQRWANSLSLFVTGRNLWIDTPFSYGDPEGNTVGPDNAGGAAFHFFSTPTTRSWTVGLRAAF